MGDEKEEAPSNTFQLRPSLLSGGGIFGLPQKCDAPSSPRKDFLLRPSSLSGATKTTSTVPEKDAKKRQHEDDVVEQETTDNLTTCNENSIKKAKTESEVRQAKKEEELKLTDDIKKPTGIGTFGFADHSENNDSNAKNKVKNGKEKTPFKTPNYFEQMKNSSGEMKFVFGSGNTNSGPVEFSSIKNSESVEENSTDLETEGDSEKNKLLENADEYQRTHGKQRQYEEVECFTGEEGEKHVLQILCKLHLFDKDKKSWLEKGRGTLKLNDISQPNGVFQSRLVFRRQGTNIVQLNTLLYPDMCCEQVKDKGIRISALNADTKEIDVFLISCNLKDRYPTFSAIERRIQAIRNRNQNTLQKTLHSDTGLSNEGSSSVS